MFAHTHAIPLLSTLLGKSQRHLKKSVVHRQSAGSISKDGGNENLRVVSGLPVLQQAALDAVKNWRYRPYLLDGQPVEVETTVNVIFKLES
jgi:TonB family protein